MSELDYSKREIEAEVILQRWEGREEDTLTDLETCRFLATESVLALPIEKILVFADQDAYPETLDALLPSMIRDKHDGPFEVDGLFLSLSVRAFFGVPDTGFTEDHITQDMLDAARAAHHVGETREYRVRVERTETRTSWIDVEANSQEDAVRAALGRAGDVEFSQSAGAPEYRATQIDVQAPEDGDAPQCGVPRPRG